MAKPKAECPTCGELRTQAQYKSGKRKGTSYWYCSPCTTRRAIDWRSANRDHANAVTRTRRTRNREQMNEWTREWRARNPEKVRAGKLQHRYNLTLEEFDALLESQGGICGSCQGDAPGGYGSWHVDHDHACCPGDRSCGKCVRGLLCNNCNVALGYLKDDPERIRALLGYLEASRLVKGK